MKPPVVAPRPPRSVSRYNRQATTCPVSGKRSYRTKRKALRIAERVRTASNGADRQRAYLCPACGKYHLTSQLQKKAVA